MIETNLNTVFRRLSSSNDSETIACSEKLSVRNTFVSRPLTLVDVDEVSPLRGPFYEVFVSAYTRPWEPNGPEEPVG